MYAFPGDNNLSFIGTIDVNRTVVADAVAVVVVITVYRSIGILGSRAVEVKIVIEDEKDDGITKYEPRRERNGIRKKEDHKMMRWMHGCVQSRAPYPN